MVRIISSSLTDLPDKIYSSNHESLIDSDTWLRVQYKKKSLLKTPSRSGTGKNSWFTGLMKCGCCGSGVSYTNSRGTQGYYLCSSKKNRGYYSCEQKPAAKKTTDPIIIQSIIDYYSQQAVIDKIRASELRVAQIHPNGLKERNELLIQLNQVETEISNLMLSLTGANAILMKYANEKIVELDARKSDIVARISAIDSSQSSDREEISLLQQLASLLHDIPDVLMNGTFDEIRDMCHLLVKKITFQQNGEIDIEYTV